jgi:predicted ATPase
VIFLDDIHWADRPSLEAVLRICRVCARTHLLVVCLARLRFYEEYPEWGEPVALKGIRFQRIDLSPLSLEASHRLLEQILAGEGNLSANLREVIVTNAEGNPFYMEELVQVLIDDSVIAYNLLRVAGRLIQPGENLHRAPDSNSAISPG